MDAKGLVIRGCTFTGPRRVIWTPDAHGVSFVGCKFSTPEDNLLASIQRRFDRCCHRL